MPWPPDRAAWTPVVREVWCRAQVSGPALPRCPRSLSKWVGHGNLRSVKASQGNKASCHLAITHLSNDISTHGWQFPPQRNARCSLEPLKPAIPFCLHVCFPPGVPLPLHPLPMLEGLLLVFQEPVKESYRLWNICQDKAGFRPQDRCGTHFC